MMTVRLKVKNKDFDPDEPPELHEDVEKPEDEDIFRGACEKEKQSHEAESVEEVQKAKQQVPVDENWITDDEDGDDFHSLCSSSDENNRNKWPEFNELTDMENPQLKLGMTFSSPQVFRQALVEWTVRQGYDIKYLKNENKRITALCKYDCGFRIHASPMQGEKTFQIKTFKPKHECGMRFQNHLVTSNYIASKYQ